MNIDMITLYFQRENNEHDELPLIQSIQQRKYFISTRHGNCT